MLPVKLTPKDSGISMKVTLLHTYFTIKALHIEVVAFANRIQSSGAKTPTICHRSNNLHGICTQSTC